MVSEASGQNADSPTEGTPLPQGVEQALLGEFLAEAREHLNEAERHLLALKSDPNQPDLLNALFRAFHTLKGDAGLLGYGEMAALGHATEDLLHQAREGTLLLAGPALQAVLASVDAMRILLDDLIRAASGNRVIPLHPFLTELVETIRKQIETRQETKMGEILVELGEISSETLKKALIEQETRREAQRGSTERFLSDEEGTADSAMERRLSDGRRGGDRGDEEGQSTSSRSQDLVRIDTARLDRLLDAIGELGTVALGVTQSPEIFVNATDETKRNLTSLAKITREIQEIGGGMRLTAIRPLFEKMARVVHNLARDVGKDVNFVMKGKDTEIDRSLVETLSAPLLHLVRNAIDHGIEDPQERFDTSKAEKATVCLEAFHEGESVIIQLSDDGRGLNPEKIMAKAIEKGLASPGADLKGGAILDLLFQPGFSTADTVTDLSGRGVGMDVVKREIEAHRGDVSLSSEFGKGTCVRIRLPLTLASIGGMIVQDGSERYVVPILSVIESVGVRTDEVITVAGQGRMLRIRDDLYPFHSLAGIFGMETEGSESREGIAVLAEAKGSRIALFVDRLLGQQLVVVKPLGDGLGRIPAVSGTTVMPNGRIALVLDISEIVRIVDA